MRRPVVLTVLAVSAALTSVWVAPVAARPLVSATTDTSTAVATTIVDEHVDEDEVLVSSTTSTPDTVTTTSLADGDEVEVVPTESEESTTTTIPEDADLSVLPEPPAGGWETVPILFPVAGPVSFYDDWGSCRGGTDCPREHAGIDVIAEVGQPLLAAEDGVISRITLDHVTAGNGLRLAGDSGWEYRYYHLNDQQPWVFGPGIEVGARVVAGQVVGWVGQTGNAADSVPHLHFEIRRPGSGEPMNPFRSVQAAQKRQKCSPVRDGRHPLLGFIGEHAIVSSGGAWFTLDGVVYAANDVAMSGGRAGGWLPACAWHSAWNEHQVVTAVDLNPDDELDAFGQPLSASRTVEFP